MTEKRSLAINEIKEVVKSELVTKICDGRVFGSENCEEGGRKW